MGYNLNYSSIRALQTAAMTSVTGWEEQYGRVQEDLMAFANETSFSGAGADAIRQYLADIHLTICQSLLVLLSEYKARFSLFVSGLYEYDNNKYANINEDALTEVTEELRRTGNELMEFREQVLGEMNGIHDLGAESILKSPEVYVSPLEDEIQKIRNLRDKVEDYEQTAFHETESLREHIAELLQVVQNLWEQGEMDISRYERGSLAMPNLDRLKTLTWNSWAFQTENQEAIGAAYAHYTEVWEEIIDEIREQRIKKGYSLVFWSAVGITATVLTFGALGPEAISMETAILGSFALAYDMSNMEEGALELYYGCVGDINTTAVNPIRDTVFFGWQEGYDVSGMAANIGFGYFSMRDLASVAGSAAGEMMVGEDLGHSSLIRDEYSGEEWYRYFRDTYGNDNVVWENATPSQLARSWQGSGKYPGIDDYIDMTVTRGTVLYRGEPNGTEYFTTLDAIEQSGRNATTVFEGLQVEKNPIHGYRGEMQGYLFNEDIASAYGITNANPQFGRGGLPQYYVPNAQDLIEKGILIPVDNVKLYK